MSLIEQRKFTDRTPLERFSVFRGKYDSLKPTRLMREGSRISNLYYQKILPSLKGDFDIDQLRDFYANRDQNEVETLRQKHNELDKAVEEESQLRMISPERQICLDEVGGLLNTAPVLHTAEFNNLVLDIVSKHFVNRWRRSNFDLLEEAVLFDPYRVGGFFHPAFAKGIESVTFSYEQNSVNAQCPWLLIEEAQQNALDRLKEIGIESSKDADLGHDEVRCQLEREAKRFKVDRWKEQFLGLFGQEPYIEVSYK